MKSAKYSCPNGCALPPRRKVLKELSEDTFGFGYEDYTYCPNCGALMPYSRDKLEAFFDVYKLHPALEKSLKLLLKSEFVAAARESFVAVETILREKSGLDGHGSDLAARALTYEVNKNTGDIITPPLIAINELKNESDRNEQNGIRFMLMGFFQGPRNLYQHCHIGSGASNAVSIVIEASFFLNLLDGHSITKGGEWIPVKVNYRDIYGKMPKLTDRIRFIWMIKKNRKRKQKR